MISIENAQKCLSLFSITVTHDEQTFIAAHQDMCVKVFKLGFDWASVHNTDEDEIHELNKNSSDFIEMLVRAFSDTEDRIIVDQNLSLFNAIFNNGANVFHNVPQLDK